MRLLCTLALWLLVATGCLANEIDQLHSLGEVTAFLRKCDRRRQDAVFFEPAVADTAASGRNRFFKLDLDTNGLTDLIVDGKYLLAVLDIGSGKYRFQFLDRRSSPESKFIQLRRIVHQGNMPLLVISSVTNQYDLSSRLLSSEIRTDSLLVRFGTFIEHQAAPARLQIARLSFSASTCEGTCPSFRLTMQADRTVTYEAESFNKKQGAFQGVIDPAAFSKLLATLQYMQFTKLKDNYQVGWTDAPTMKLEIMLANGQVKRIEDYGGEGTFGLANLYAQLFALRESQNWK